MKDEMKLMKNKAKLRTGKLKIGESSGSGLRKDCVEAKNHRLENLLEKNRLLAEKVRMLEEKNRELEEQAKNHRLEKLLEKQRVLEENAHMLA